MRSENSPPDDDLTANFPEAKAEEKPAVPLLLDPAESERSVSPERQAMRQLQGRIRKKLLVKRPVRSSEMEDEDAAPNSESVTAASVKVEEPLEETTAPPTEVPNPPVRPAVRIEKSSDVFPQLHNAIEHAVGSSDFQTGDLTNAPLFKSKQPVVLGVTSAIEGEGKTTVALRLAIEIARDHSRKVCLMDMSLGLGEGTMSRRLGIDTRAGLVPVLEGTHHTLSTIEVAEYDGLSMIPAGKTPEDPVLAARSPALPEILRAARKIFDVIVIDMPAITSGNALPIAPYVDAVVMVVTAGVTPKEVVADALERLDRNKVLGLVLNRATTKTPS